MKQIKKCVILAQFTLFFFFVPAKSDICEAKSPVTYEWVDDLIDKSNSYRDKKLEERKAEVAEEKERLRIAMEKKKREEARRKRIAEIKRKKRLLELKRKKRMREIKKCCGVAVSDKQRIILERIVEAEAGGENHKGKVLVANVVLNRVKSKSFPSTIEGVVFSHRGNRYQFSPISDGRYYTVTVSKDTKSAVRDALRGIDPSEGALYFMERALADSSNASWFDRCLTRLFSYGCHEFYK